MVMMNMMMNGILIKALFSLDIELLQVSLEDLASSLRFFQVDFFNCLTFDEFDNKIINLNLLDAYLESNSVILSNIDFENNRNEIFKEYEQIKTSALAYNRKQKLFFSKMQLLKCFTLAV